MSRISKRYLIIGGVLGLGIIVLIIGAIRPYKHALGAPPAMSPIVEVVQVQQEDVPIYGEWIGTLDGLVNADVRAQVTGYLLKQGYQEGAFVKQGQLLFQIDPRPFQAALDQAQGQLAQAKATLANSQAVQRRTELDVERYTPLVREQAASQQDLDNAVQNNLAALATIETAKAQIKTYEAAVETAKSISNSRVWSRRSTVLLGRRSCKSGPWSVQAVAWLHPFLRWTRSKSISLSVSLSISNGVGVFRRTPVGWRLTRSCGYS